jgi:hypothetical protein
MTTATPTKQERRWDEAVERYQAHYGLDGAAILEARVRVFQKLADEGVDDRAMDDRATAIARRWLKRHVVEVA